MTIYLELHADIYIYLVSVEHTTASSSLQCLGWKGGISFQSKACGLAQARLGPAVEPFQHCDDRAPRLSPAWRRRSRAPRAAQQAHRHAQRAPAQQLRRQARVVQSEDSGGEQRRLLQHLTAAAFCGTQLPEPCFSATALHRLCTLRVHPVPYLTQCSP